MVVGVGGSCAGARAAIELIKGRNHNLRKGDPQIFFAGDNLSTRAWQELCALLEGKDFAINIISKSGSTTEPAIAARALRWMLERKYGADKARKHIFITTDPVRGALRQLAAETGCESFVIPSNVGGRFSVLTAAGLLPMAVAGLDVTELMIGAAQAKRELSMLSFENPAWQYAAGRNLLYQTGKKIELLCCGEPSFRALASWWQQLFAASEGKDGKGVFPAAAEFPADLHGLGQMIQEGERSFFETVLRFRPCRRKTLIEADWRDLDGLNYLEGKSLDFVEENAFLGAIAAQTDAGVPVLLVQADEICDRALGELFFFFQLSCGISAYLLGVDPFRQPGAELCKRSVLRQLGKPGFAR